MNISYKIEGIDDLLDKFDELTDGERMKRALAAAGEIVSSDAKANAPVKTGRLRQSIVSIVEGNEAIIGPTVNYGTYVEFGTGAKGDSSVAHTTKKSWTYHSGGRYYTTSGQKPHPFLVPALKNNVSEIAAKFREIYSSND